MNPYFQEMEMLGVDKYVLANITLHEAFDAISPHTVNTRLLHIRDILHSIFDGVRRKILITGSLYTMNSAYLPSLFPLGSIEMVHASPRLQKQLDDLRKIYYLGRQDADRSGAVFSELTRSHPEVEAFVIACTEHALALREITDQSRFLNLPRLQITHLLKYLTDSP